MVHQLSITSPSCGTTLRYALCTNSCIWTAPEEINLNTHHASAQYVGPSCENPLTQILVQSCHASELLLEASIAGFSMSFNLNQLPGLTHEASLHNPDVTLQHVNITPLLQAVIPKGVRVVHVPESTLTEKGTDTLGCALGHRLSGSK